MKKLAALVVVAVLVALYLVADTFARHQVERALAKQVSTRVPGTSTTVTIRSLPFTGRLAAGGDVPSIIASVSGVTVGPFAVQSVAIDVEGLVVDRSKLLQGNVDVKRVRSATVTAVVTQGALDRGSGLPITLGAGTVGIGGLQAPAAVRVTDRGIEIAVAGLRTITVPALPASLIPCTLTGHIDVGQLVVSCTTTTVPPALTQALAGATGS